MPCATTAARSVFSHRFLDQPRDPLCVALLAELADHRHERVLIDRAQQLERGGAARGIHAHVERARLAEREPALGMIELRRRHAEVGEDAIDLRDAEPCENLADVAELAMDQLRGIAEPGLRGRQGGRVAVDPDQPPARPRDRARVAAAADRTVDINPVFSRG
jgi:hypothetical protein